MTIEYLWEGIDYTTEGIEVKLTFLAESNKELMQLLAGDSLVIPAGMKINSLSGSYVFKTNVRVVEISTTYNDNSKTTVYSILVSNSVSISLVDEQRIMLFALPEFVKRN